MAISIAQQYYSDLTNITDPLRMLQGFDYFGHSDQMEFTITTGLDESIDRNNFPANQNHDLQGLVDEAIEFSDSPQDSPESWPTDYQKSLMHVSAIEVQQQHLQQQQQQQPPSPQQAKKRRMDWDSLDLNAGINTIGVEAKVLEGTGFNTKERERNRKNANGARLGWTDDIDFDLNTELTNNSYLNNDSIFSLSSLTALKQETPSQTVGDATKKVSKLTHTIAAKDNDQTQLNHASDVIKSSPSNITDRNNDNLSNIHLANINNNSSSNESAGLVEKSGGELNHNYPNAKNENDQPADDKSTDEPKFQYVLAAATSIATKNNEETITYLNQGQSYEIKLKKLGDLSTYRGKLLKSIIKICFHERRLQYMEREQMHQWQASRPGERIVEIDVPLSYGLCHVAQPHNLNQLNVVEVLWDPMKEVGVYIKINCISTEFTPKKHGGEKGVPFRIQIETYVENTCGGASATNVHGEALKPIHAAACQIKVFKLKGADRKHKQDREKIQKRPASEKEKYQPSYECTILNDLPSDAINVQNSFSPEHIRTSASGSPLMSNSPIHTTKFDGIFSTSNGPVNPIGINSVSSSNSNMKIMDQSIASPPQHQTVESDEFINSCGVSSSAVICKDTTPTALAQWMNMNRLGQYANTFSQFTGADVLRMSKDDLIQICGLADGIRMYNTLHSKALAPRLTIYVSFDGSSYHAIYLHASTTKELAQKMCKLPGFNEYMTGSPTNVENNAFTGWNLQSKYSGSGSNLYDASKLNIYIYGPAGIHVYVTGEVLGNIKDESLFALEFMNNKILMKIVYKNEIN